MAPVSVFRAIVARVVPRYLSCGMPVGIPQVPVGLSSGSLFPAFLVGSSSSGFPWRPPSPFFWLCPERWVVFLALSSACHMVVVRCLFTVPGGLVGASATFHVGPTPGLSLASCLFHRCFPRVLSVCAFLDSRLLCSLASWLVLGSSFPVLVVLWLPLLRGSLFGFLILH